MAGQTRDKAQARDAQIETWINDNSNGKRTQDDETEIHKAGPL